MLNDNVYKDAANMQIKLIRHNIDKMKQLIDMLEPVVCEDYYESDKRKSLELLQTITQVSTNAVNKSSLLYFNRYAAKMV